MTITIIQTIFYLGDHDHVSNMCSTECILYVCCICVITVLGLEQINSCFSRYFIIQSCQVSCLSLTTSTAIFIFFDFLQTRFRTKLQIIIFNWNYTWYSHDLVVCKFLCCCHVTCVFEHIMKMFCWKLKCRHL